MTARPPVVFIGPMAAGKTKVGKRVASLAGLAFTDTDKAVVAKHGPIAAIFDTRGEAAFRALEREEVAAALASDHVVALGGGAVLDDRTREELRELPVVFLRVSPEAVASRLGDGKRPLVRDGLAQWERIFAARLPIYEELADLTIDTSPGDFDDIARRVVAWLRS